MNLLGDGFVKVSAYLPLRTHYILKYQETFEYQKKKNILHQHTAFALQKLPTLFNQ